MNYLRQISFLFFLVFLGSSFSATAEEQFKDASELVGTWALTGTAKSRDSEKRPSNNIWEFRSDGVVVTSGYDKRLPGGDFEVSSPFKVEKGILMTAYPGRPGKFIEYTLIEKDQDSMILKQGLGQFMFFKRK